MNRLTTIARMSLLVAMAVLPWQLGLARGVKPAASQVRSARAVQATDRLVNDCAKKAYDLRRRLDKTFSVKVMPPFVVAGDVGAERLERYCKTSITEPANAMWASYFQKKPDAVITILLMDGDKSYRHWANELFQDTDVAHFGYYRPSSHTLIMNIATGAGTLVHELTHALMAFDFPTAPLWFNECMASLHEQCQVDGNSLVGGVNWRLPALQSAIRNRTLRPLDDLMRGSDFYGKQMSVNYAQARFFAMYMQQQGLLGDVYRHYRDNCGDGKTARRSIEAVSGKKLEQVERGFKTWALSLKYGN